MLVKSLTPMTHRSTPQVQAQKMALIGEILGKVSGTATFPTGHNLLLSLLRDPASLSQFIRYSSLSQEMSASLLKEVAQISAAQLRASPIATSRIENVLGKIKPAYGSIDASYGDAVSFGKVKSEDPAMTPLPFQGRFSPTQSDFERTIDELKISSADEPSTGSDDTRAWFKPAEVEMHPAKQALTSTWPIVVATIVAAMLGVILYVT